MQKRKTWQEKLHNGKEPKVVRLPSGETLLVGTPLLVKEYVESIPEGTTVTVEQMRRDLAERFGADKMCPMSTGIFVWIVREAAEEDRAAGRVAAPVERLISPAKRGSRYRAQLPSSQRESPASAGLRPPRSSSGRRA